MITIMKFISVVNSVSYTFSLPKLLDKIHNQLHFETKILKNTILFILFKLFIRKNIIPLTYNNNLFSNATGQKSFILNGG